MESNDTLSEVSFWVSKYILLRNTQKLSSFANIPESIKHFAAEQGAIGWREFTEGRISKALFEVQRVHLDQVRGRMRLERWSQQLITKVLHIFQSQWIHRNSSLHHKACGYLDEKVREEQDKDIERYLQTDEREIPNESRHLIEVDPDEIVNATSDCRSYWLLAMKAAKKTGRRMAGGGRRTGTGKCAEAKRKRWNSKMKAQLTVSTREAEKATEGWGDDTDPPKKSRLDTRRTSKH